VAHVRCGDGLDGVGEGVVVATVPTAGTTPLIVVPGQVAMVVGAA
jgi:hypothetical protein